MPTRTFLCLNRNCLTEFDSQAEARYCPRCRGNRVRWVPKPVAIMSGATKRADETVRNLATDFGMTNVNSPVRGQRAAPPVPPSNIVNFRMSNAPAWGGQFAIGEDGKPRAMCIPTGVKGKMKGGAIIDQRARYTPGRDLGGGSEIVGSSGTAADIANAVKGLK